MEQIKRFLKSKQAVRFATVTSLFLVASHFAIIALFEVNVVKDILAFGTDFLTRVYSATIAVVLFVVMYGSYTMDRTIVNTRLQKIKAKIREEAADIRDELARKKAE